MGEICLEEKEGEGGREKISCKNALKMQRNGIAWLGVHPKIHCLIDPCSQRLKNKAEIKVDMDVDVLSEFEVLASLWKNLEMQWWVRSGFI